VSAAALPALANDLEPLRVNVPFAFTAGTTNLPAGEYSIYEEDSGMIKIRGERGSVFILSTAGNDPDTDKTGLTFQHTEKGYFLNGIHEHGKTSLSVAPPASRNER
jgi:hypothetical protein